MKRLTNNCLSGILLITAAVLVPSCTWQKTGQGTSGSATLPDHYFDKFPAMTISNDQVSMKIYLPDQEKGLYRATRFDWSGVIGSVLFKGHEYFGYWKDTHDPMFHEDLSGPVEGYIEPGPGFDEASPGEGFIRIGVGILEREDEQDYVMRKTYKITDHGTWNTEHGQDWISFTHRIDTRFGYGYLYQKTIQLKADGFTIAHILKNTGEKPIETDQFNHNFFRIDGEPSGTAFQISFPYAIYSEDDLKGLLEIEGQNLTFIRDLGKEENVFLILNGYSRNPADHQVTVLNRKTGAGVTFSVDQPLHRMAFWACATTLSPENSIWIAVAPGEEQQWTSDYTLFAE